VVAVEPELVTVLEFVSVLVVVVVTTPPSDKVEVPVLVTVVTELLVEPPVVEGELPVLSPLPEVDELGPQAATKITYITVRTASKRVRMTDSSGRPAWTAQCANGTRAQNLAWLDTTPSWSKIPSRTAHLATVSRDADLELAGEARTSDGPPSGS
jgi:hypothetical protein